MKFGSIPVSEAAGSILAHSLQVSGRRFRKGLVLTERDVESLSAADVAEVTVAKLSPEDVGEDEAASRLADALLLGTERLGRSAAFTGRVNIYAEAPGLVLLDAEAVTRLNSINPSITLATLPNLERVSPRSLVATAKIITFAVPATDLNKAIDAASGILSHMPVVKSDAGLVVTRSEGQAERIAEKGKAAVATRLSRLGMELNSTRIVPHRPECVGEALSEIEGEILLLLTGSATSDMLDVGPEGLRRAGGKVHRFGIPVDPGNLLFHGDLGGRPVIGLPGCARSPALNGADWVLERTACGIDISDRQFAGMGVGGLLKEIPLRPQPRAGKSESFARPRIAAIVLVQEAARHVEDVLTAVRATHAELIRVVAETSVGRDLPIALKAPREALVAAGGGSKSGLLEAGIAAVAEDADAVLVLRGEDPPPEPGLLDRMMAAFSPKDGREICRPFSNRGNRGPPILFGRRFFEALSGLDGERGGSQILKEAEEFLCEIQE